MNSIYKTKSQVRSEMNDALAEFLAKGGTITVAKPSKRGSKNGRKMKATGTRSYQAGSSGMPRGYTRSTMG